VFQDANLFAHLSAEANLRYGLTRSGAGHPAIGFDATVAMLGLAPLLARHPATLSGGERQRVAIGRALLAQPRLLLVDEPLSAVDQTAREAILGLLERLCAEVAIPVVYVSHDLAEVTRLAHHLILVDAGRVVGDGPIERILTDLHLPLAALPQAGVVLDAVVSGSDPVYGLTQYQVDGGLFVAPSRGLAVGARCRLRILASDVSLCRVPPVGTTILNTPRGVIVAADSFDGMQTNVLIRLGDAEGGARVLARVTRKSWESLGFVTGETIHALVKGVGLLEGGPER
jgi:molybdate transport system ATP-binding protein